MAWDTNYLQTNANVTKSRINCFVFCSLTLIASAKSVKSFYSINNSHKKVLYRETSLQIYGSFNNKRRHFIFTTHVL